MPDALPKDRLGLLLRTCWRRAPRFILPALSAFILKNGQMPLLKRINTASGVSLCQEKSAIEKSGPQGLKPSDSVTRGGTTEVGPFPFVEKSEFFRRHALI